MPLRKLLLRGMLWSLGLAAGAGVLAALTGGSETVWRVVGTGFVTALGCGLLIPVSALLERDRTRDLGLAGIVVVLVEFVLALCAIWEVPGLLFDVNWEDELALTMFFLGLGAVLVGLSVLLAHTEHSRLAGKVGAGVAVLTFLCWMVAVWAFDNFTGQADWWESGMAVFSMGLLVFTGLIGAGVAPRRTWRWAAVAASVVAFALWMSNVWLDTESALGSVIFAALVALAAVIGHANLCLLVPLSSGQRWLRVATVAVAVLTGAATVLLVVKEEYPGAALDVDLLGRLTAAAAIAAGCGTMALLVLAIINRGRDREAPAADLSAVTVVCPRCGKKQAIPIGASACERCGLRISVRVEEPAGA